MIAYVDASVLLRLVLGQKGRLREWRRIDIGVASALVEVECLRTIDRLRLAEGLGDPDVLRLRKEVFRRLDVLEIVDLDRMVLSRAALPLSISLGTLDAIHLSTALLWKEESGKDLVMATHDRALADASRGAGLAVVGA